MSKPFSDRIIKASITVLMCWHITYQYREKCVNTANALSNWLVIAFPYRVAVSTVPTFWEILLFSVHDLMDLSPRLYASQYAGVLTPRVSNKINCSLQCFDSWPCHVGCCNIRHDVLLLNIAKCCLYSGPLFPKQTPPHWYRGSHYKRSPDRLRFIIGIPIPIE